MVNRVQSGPATGLLCVLGLLGVLAATEGLGEPGWVVGAACGAGLGLALTRGQRASGLGPADRVTLARAVLGCGVAALTADSFTGAASVGTLVTLATAALVLDFVDGQVARRTHTTSTFGARFDLEADAFLILVLSVYAGRTTGWWVLAIGAARYLFVLGGWMLPWLRGSVPPRHWCKVVAAFQGVVLTVAAAGVLPDALTTAVLVLALSLLAESFGREAWQLWEARLPAGGGLQPTAGGLVRDG